MSAMTRLEGRVPGLFLLSLALLLLLATCVQDTSAKSYGLIHKEKGATDQDVTKQADILQNYRKLLHKMNILKRSLKTVVTSRGTLHNWQQIYDETALADDLTKRILVSIPRTFDNITERSVTSCPETKLVRADLAYGIDVDQVRSLYPGSVVAEIVTETSAEGGCRSINTFRKELQSARSACCACGSSTHSTTSSPGTKITINTEDWTTDPSHPTIPKWTSTKNTASASTEEGTTTTSYTTVTDYVSTVSGISTDEETATTTPSSPGTTTTGTSASTTTPGSTPSESTTVEDTLTTTPSSPGKTTTGTSASTTTPGSTPSESTTETEYTGSTCVTASAEIVELIHDLNANLTDVRAQIEETFSALMDCAGNYNKLEEASNLADVLDSLVIELRNIIAKLESMRGSTRRLMMSSLYSSMGTMSTTMRGLCVSEADDLVSSLRHLTRAIRTMKYEPERQTAQDNLACSSHQVLKQMTKVIQGGVSLSSEESVSAQRILTQLVTRDVQQVKSAVTQHTRANDALHERLQHELDELKTVQETTEHELAKVHAESMDRLRAAGCQN